MKRKPEPIRVLPEHPAFYAEEAEMALLGSAIIARSQSHDKHLVRQFADLMRPEMFWRPIHRELCRIVLEQWNAGNSPDFVTVTAQAEREGVHGFNRPLLVQIGESTPSVANLLHYAAIVRDAWARRELHGRIRDVALKVTNAEYPVEEILGDVDRAGDGLSASHRMAALSEVDLAADADLAGVPTGLPTLDRLLVNHGGWPAGHTSFVCARTGCGKTALMIGALRAALLANVPCGFVSLEMSAKEITRRIMLAETGWYRQPLNLDLMQAWDVTLESVKAEPVMFLEGVDRDDRTIEGIRAWCHRVKARQGLGILFVDYCQLLRLRDAKGMRGFEQHAEISKGLKELAVELNTPVIVGAQINDDGTIRGSRDYLFDASVHLEIQREKGASAAQIIVHKNRNGEEGITFPAVFDRKHAQYREAA